MTTSYFRKKLNKQLALASDEGFIQLLWAVNGIQSETQPNTEGVLLPFDEEFITTDVANKRYVYKWMIETLANEKLTIPHESKIRNNQEKVLDTRHQLGGLALKFEPGVLMRLVASQRGDPLDEIENGSRGPAFLVENGRDNLLGLGS